MEKGKKLKTVSGKCENCGSDVKFDPASQNLKCESCGTVKVFEKKRTFAKHDYKENIDAEHCDWVNQNKFIQCKNCGARIVLSKLDIARLCPYCASNYVVQIDQLPAVKPDSVVPFEFDETEAVRHFKNGVKKKFFVPKVFKKEIPRNKVHGVYVSTFVFDVKTKSTYFGELGESITYKTTDGHSRTTTRYFPIKGALTKNFENKVIESSSVISDYDLQTLLPFDMSKACDFDVNFIKGYNMEYYDKQLKNCFEMCKSSFESSIRNEILQKYDYNSVGSLTIKTDYIDPKYNYRLLPIYNLEYKYKNKTYISYVNGQSGQIGGDLPLSKIKISLVVILGLVLIAGLTALIFIMGGK